MRIFKPEPNVEISENAATTGKTVDEVKRILANMGYPQVLNSTVRETQKDGDTVVEFLPAAGKKG